MILDKPQFNKLVATNQIDIRPDDTAYINGVKYKILPVLSTDIYVVLEEIKEGH